MGKRMTAGRRKQDKIIMTVREYRQTMREFSDDATMKAMLLVSGYLMDEPEINFDGDRLGRMWEKVDEWMDTIKDPDIDFNWKDLAKVIEEHTGIKVRWD